MEQDQVRNLPERSKPVSAQATARSDVGLVRSHNEDAFLAVDLTSGRGLSATRRLGPAGALLGVCDGMGGAAAGEVASAIAADSIPRAMVPVATTASRNAFANALIDAMLDAGQAIRDHAKAHPSQRGMGTTCTVAAIRRGELLVGQVGDSRAYVFRQGKLVQVTKDQSLANQLVEFGHLAPDDAQDSRASHIILQALGSTERVRVDLTSVVLRRGDRVLLCSDGLSGLVPSESIRQTLASQVSLDLACEELVALAKQAGGSDNITVVLCDVSGDGLEPPRSEDELDYLPFRPDPDSVMLTPYGESDALAADDAQVPYRFGLLSVLLASAAVLCLGGVFAYGEWSEEPTAEPPPAIPTAPVAAPAKVNRQAPPPAAPQTMEISPERESETARLVAPDDESGAASARGRAYAPKKRREGRKHSPPPPLWKAPDKVLTPPFQ